MVFTVLPSQVLFLKSAKIVFVNNLNTHLKLEVVYCLLYKTSTYAVVATDFNAAQKRQVRYTPLQPLIILLENPYM